MINSNTYKFFITAATIAGCCFIFSCKNSIEEINALKNKKTNTEEADSVESYLSQEGVVKAKLTAPYMLRQETDTPITEFPKTLHVIFYDDTTATPQSYLFAKYGRYLEKQGKVLLRDSVVVFNVKGDTLNTNELWWDREKGIFYNSKPVRIRQPYGQTFNGDSILADQSFHEWTLYNGSGIRNVPDSTLPQ